MGGSLFSIYIITSRYDTIVRQGWRGDVGNADGNDDA
jgi:hypothetical protein